MLRSLFLAGLISLNFFPSRISLAQTHFQECTNGQGNVFNATIIIPETVSPSINGRALRSGSEIAVFASTSGGEALCVGSTAWFGRSTALPIWGDDPLTPIQDGLLKGSSFSFRVFDTDTGVQISPRAIFSSFETEPHYYEDDAVFILNRLEAFLSYSGLSVADQHAEVVEDSSIVLDISSNVIPPSGQFLEIAGFESPANGTAALESESSIRYNPAPDFFGADSLTYVVRDENQKLGEGLLRFSILPVNDRPQFTNAPPSRIEAGGRFEFQIEVADADNDSLTLGGHTLPYWLTFTDQSDGTGILSASPTEADVGAYVVVLEASDGSASTLLQLVLTIANGTNQAPIAASDEFMINEDEKSLLDVLANDSDPDGHSLQLSSIGTADYAALQIVENKVQIIPEEDFFGRIEFEYTVEDSLGLNAAATVTVEIVAVNDIPVFDSEPVLSVKEGEQYSYVVSASDAEGDAITILLGNAPAWLTLQTIPSESAAALLSGTPGPTEVGLHTVSLSAADSLGSQSQEFTVTVVAQSPSAPIAVPVLSGVEEMILDAPAVVLSWDAVENATEYHIQIAEELEEELIAPIVDEPGYMDVSYSVDGIDSEVDYHWRVRAGVQGEYGAWSDIHRFRYTPTREEEDLQSEGHEPHDDTPLSFSLLQNYPNPFNPATTIEFDAPTSTHVTIELFDLLGHRVRTLFDQTVDTGRHAVRLLADDLPSGIYVYRMRANVYVESRTLSLIK